MQITVGRVTSRSNVKQKEVNDSVKQLGVLTNSAGDFSNELERQQEYSSSMATRIQTLHLKPKMPIGYIKTSGCQLANICWL
eukprot:6886363-Ditylum_brightwellii.AAC.1